MTYTFLEPYTFKNGVTAKNRIVIPPMTEGSALYDGTVSQDELNFLPSEQVMRGFSFHQLLM